MPTAPAACSGAGAPTVRKSCTLRMATLCSAGAIAYPRRHPVQLKVFESPEMVTVRSFMPGKPASRWCVPP